MPSRNHLVDDILDLCDEQGFRHELLAGRTGVRIYPKRTGIDPTVLHFNSSEAGREAENTKARVRRIGLRFPIDVERERRRIAKTRTITMVEQQMKSNGHLPPAQPPPTIPPTISPFVVMRAKLNLAIAALGELEEAINRAEMDQKSLQALRDVLRQVSL